MNQNPYFHLGLIASFVIIVGAGMWGQCELPQYRDDSFGNLLYRSLQLFVFEGDWIFNPGIDGTPGPSDPKQLPLQIEIARFFAPLLSVITIVILLVQDIGRKFKKFLVYWTYSRHIIILGLGQKELLFARSCKDNKRKIVIIEKDPLNPLIEDAWGKGFPVITGDGGESRTLKNSTRKNPKDIIIFSEDDGQNIQLATEARKFWKSDSLTIHVHAQNPHFADQLENYPKYFLDDSPARISFFNFYEISSRQLFRKYPPDIYADIRGAIQVHLGIFGFGLMGEHVLLEAIRICHFKNESPLKVTVYSPEAKEKETCFEKTYPEISNKQDKWNIEFKEINFEEEHFVDGIDPTTLNTLTQVFVCLDSDEKSLKAALHLRQTSLNKFNFNAPVWVRMKRESGLTKLIQSNTGEPEIPDKIFPFGMLDEALTYEFIIKAELDSIARGIHKEYLNSIGTADPKTVTQNPAQQPWEVLPESFRKSNRWASDHFAVKLRAIGARIVDHIDSSLQYKDKEREILAEMEHRRWNAEKYSLGWQYDEKRFDPLKKHPNLVEWDQLDDKDKSKDFDQIDKIPEILRSVGKGCQRDFVIGVTGSPLNNIDLKNPPGKNSNNKENPANKKAIKDWATAKFKCFKETHQNCFLIIMSSLATEIERIIAESAIKELGAKLVVPLPLPFELFISSFGDITKLENKNSIEEFKRLIGLEETFYFELPLKFGSMDELKNINHKTRKMQYALAGAFIVERCDELLAVWDGNNLSEIGGTGQIVEWRRRGKIEENFTTPERFFPRPPFKEPIIFPD